MRLVIAAFALSVAFTSMAHADYMDYHFKVRCDPGSNRAEIVPYAVWNEDVYSAAPQDCVLSNRRSVRAKMGLGPTYPYGMGGGDPSKWISVWVDKVLVLSRVYFGCDDQGPCSIRITVTAKGLNVCNRELRDFSEQQVTTKEPDEQCAFTPNHKLSKRRDSLEYPLPNERARPAAGSLATLYARDKTFCSQFHLIPEPRDFRSWSEDNISPLVGLPNGAASIKPEGESTYEYSGVYQRYAFDINNDRKNEIAVGLHARTHYRDGDVYFVYADDKVPNPAVEKLGSTRSELSYAREAKRIIPHFWSDYIGKDEKMLVEKDKDSGFYEIKNASTPWWDSKDKPVFRFRYWYLWPFRYKQSTYFLTWSQEADKRHWYAVLRPNADYRVTEMCVFQIVPVRY
jgi:hypothetical protein